MEMAAPDAVLAKLLKSLAITAVIVDAQNATPKKVADVMDLDHASPAACPSREFPSFHALRDHATSPRDAETVVALTVTDALAPRDADTAQVLAAIDVALLRHPADTARVSAAKDALTSAASAPAVDAHFVKVEAFSLRRSLPESKSLLAKAGTRGLSSSARLLLMPNLLASTAMLLVARDAADHATYVTA